MRREPHVRFCEGGGVKLPSATRLLLTFERRADAERTATALPERLAKFGLRLHEDKTRLIEFGRFAATNRRRRSEGRPQTFDFLGFTHDCGKTWDGGFMVHRKTQRGRLINAQAEGSAARIETADAHAVARTAWMAGSRATGALRLLWRHRQQLWPAPLPDPDCQSLAWSNMAARAKATNVVGPFQGSAARQPAAAAAARARLARTSGLIRGYSSEEPDAGKLQVRICGGGGGRPPPLPDRLVPTPRDRTRRRPDTADWGRGRRSLGVPLVRDEGVKSPALASFSAEPLRASPRSHIRLTE